MILRISIVGSPSRSLVIEPWGEEFDINAKRIDIEFHSIGDPLGFDLQIDCSEEGFLRIENPLNFRPKVMIDGQEDERPAFALS